MTPKNPGRFDYYVRTVTTAVLALLVVGATIYAILERSGQTSETLTVWGGVVLGFYFGQHTAINGADARARIRAGALGRESQGEHD